MVDLLLSSVIFITTAILSAHGNPILGGCVTQSSLEMAECERDIRFRIGFKNDTATDCCVYWALVDCFEEQLNKRCDKERVKELNRYLHADHTVKVSADCKTYPNRFYCELHFIGFWFFLLLIILAIIIVIIIMVWVIIYMKRRFLPRKDHSRSNNNSNNSTKETIRTAAPLVNSKIDDL